MSGHADVSDRLPGFASSLIDRHQLAKEIDEPLLQSAPVMFERAMGNCESGAATDDCQAYHAIWQYLRLARINRGPFVDGPLFVAAAEDFARNGQLKHALISAAADYSMLAYLGFAARRGGAVPAFDVVDRCKTSLHMNKWYAARRELNVRTFQSEILAFQPDRQYDLVCAHSFLNWHSSRDRRRLFQTWRDWLAPGGRLCFSNRVYPDAIPYSEPARRRRIQALQKELPEQLAKLGVPLPCSEQDFLALVHRFGFLQRDDQPVMSVETIRSWIADAGLELEAVVPVAKVLRIETDGPLLTDPRRDRIRIWFLARRPS